MVRHDAVEVGCGRPIAPNVLIPAVSQDPATGRQGMGPVRNAAQALVERVGLAVHLLQGLRIKLQMQVRVGEPGEDDAPAEVLLFGSGILGAKLIAAHCQNLAVIYYHSRGERCDAIERINAGVAQDLHGLQ